MKAASAVVVWLLLAGGAAAAQDATLTRVDSLTAAGNVHDARETLLRWWDARWPAAPREDLQRALWLRARLTVDPAMAEADYLRLVVEYPGGPWSDAALLRLGLSARSRGEARQARTHLEALARDYPASPLSQEALRWLADLENGDRAGSAEVPASGGPAAAAVAASHAVQVGAFSTEDGARTLAERVREAGFDPRRVRLPGDPLVRVRVGRFGDPASAVETARRLGRLGFDTRLVDDVDREHPVP